MEFLEEDLDMKLIFLTAAIVLLFIAISAIYNLKLNKMQSEYDLKAAKLEEIERQLISQEEKLEELSKSSVLISEDKSKLEENYNSIKASYETLRLEKETLSEEIESRPFSNTLCKASGNVKCLS